MPTVVVGKKVPAFSAPLSNGGARATWKLADAAGETLLIYFYPKDMTTGCTKESQDFRDRHPAFRRAKARVIGVSRDSLRSHDKFREKEKLPFGLLSDEDE